MSDETEQVEVEEPMEPILTPEQSAQKWIRELIDSCESRIARYNGFIEGDLRNIEKYKYKIVEDQVAIETLKLALK